LGTTKFGGNKKHLNGNYPRMHSRGYQPVLYKNASSEFFGGLRLILPRHSA